MTPRRVRATALSIAAACVLIWFTYVNIEEMLGEPYFGFEQNMDKFSYAGLALFLAIEAALIAILVAALRASRHT